MGNFERMLHTSSFLVSGRNNESHTHTSHLAVKHTKVISVVLDLPRHFLCLKGMTSMDFSKGAMLACCGGRLAETGGGDGGDGTQRSGPLAGCQQTPRSCSGH